MKPGDLVIFAPNSKGNRAGTLTAVKFFERTKQRVKGRVGVIIEDHGDNCAVMFGIDVLILNKNFLEVIKKDENRITK